MALRRYIKMLYDRDPSKLKGVFILVCRDGQLA